MFAKKTKEAGLSALAAGLAEIDALERDIVLGRDQLWEWNGVSAEEQARFRPGVVAQAKAVTDQLRDEYRARVIAADRSTEDFRRRSLQQPVRA